MDSKSRIETLSKERIALMLLQEWPERGMRKRE